MAARAKPPAGCLKPVLVCMALAAALVIAAVARANTFAGTGLASCGIWTADRQELFSGDPGTLGYQSA
jgi:hypothetical protein